jgi:CcmD family protein
MTVMKRLACAALLAFSCAMAAPAAAQSQPPQPQDEFVPVGNSPAPEQIPAAPLLIGAYVVVLVGLFAYVVSLSRRLSAVQHDVARLEGDVKRKGR